MKGATVITTHPCRAGSRLDDVAAIAGDRLQDRVQATDRTETSKVEIFGCRYCHGAGDGHAIEGIRPQGHNSSTVDEEPARR